jgi:cytochrome c biogenesis protein CcdA/thiol-disulfide isomerase/thioredoxin
MNFFAYGLAFLEGLGLILSPCILPILPIVLSVGIEGARWRPYGIIVGFVISFSALTLLSRQLITTLGIDVNVIRYISFVLLFLFGLVLISDSLSEKFTKWTTHFANLGEKLAQTQAINSGFLGGLFLGVGIGCIWIPCAGPIMAAVIVQTVTQQTTIETVFTLLSFSLGASLPMLFLILMGRRIMKQVSSLKSYTGVIRKMLGIIILISVVYSAWPAGASFAPTEAPKENINPPSEGLVNGLPTPYTAPNIAGIQNWINSSPLSLDSLKGKVVLIDFWTYSCINCVRTLPHLIKWDETYRNNGLVIIGIHTPEFAFEMDLKNVQNAVKQHNIHYSVALDNAFKTWLNFKNRYWPAHYLIDREGKIVYTHFGEGNYDVTESNIRYLLGLTSKGETPVQAIEIGTDPITPETYLGSERAERFASPSVIIPDQPFDYPNVSDITLNSWSLEGKWIVEKQRSVCKEAQAKLKLHFNAKKVFLVLGSETGQPLKAKITFNGQGLGKNSGADVKNDEVTITKDTLYELVSLPSFAEGQVEIQALEPGLQVYAFSFGR